MDKTDKVGLKSKAKIKRKSIALTEEAFGSIDVAERRMKANKDLTGNVAARVSKAASRAIVSEMTKMINEIDEVEGVASSPISKKSAGSDTDPVKGHQEELV